MTLSAHRRRDHRRARRTTVYLDGREVKDCFYADGRRGIVRKFIRNVETGLLRLTPDKRRVAQAELHGKVRIVVHDR